MIFVFIFNNFVYAFSYCEKCTDDLSYRKTISKLRLIKKNRKKIIFLKNAKRFSFINVHQFLKKKFLIDHNNLIGFFKKNKFKIFYIVQLKDTLYSIAKKFGYNCHELSNFNCIKNPYKIFIGQKIWIGNVFVYHNHENFFIKKKQKTNNNTHDSCNFVFKKITHISYFLKNTVKCKKNSLILSCLKQKNTFSLKNKYSIENIQWYWPVKNKKFQYFYHKNSKDKGLEIPGFIGQPVLAAANGEVVLITNAFKKYGQLIIIRHNNNYLSIYAFNQSILVMEKEQVKAKQQISTMGFVKHNFARLYFEIRYKGTSVNPLNILPKK